MGVTLYRDAKNHVVGDISDDHRTFRIIYRGCITTITVAADGTLSITTRRCGKKVA